MKWFELFGGGDSALAGFTPRAQRVLAESRKEADRLNHSFVGTEHLLLGLMKQSDQGVTVKCLGLDYETVRKEVEKQVGPGVDGKIVGKIPYTPRVKKVLALAAKDAKAMSHAYVGTERILLGLMAEGDGVAPRVLKNLGVDLEKMRSGILNALGYDASFTDVKSNPSAMTMNTEQQTSQIDTAKRYDVYCAEGNQQMVVYRNVLFRGRRKLLSTQPHEVGGIFLELEQSNGQTVFLALLSVRKFCEHGGEILGEIVTPK